MGGINRFSELSKPPNPPARKLLKIKQDQQIKQGRLTEFDPFAGLKIVFPDSVLDVGAPAVDLNEGACAALAMRWLSTRLAGLGDAAFRDGKLDDLGAMQASYLKTVRAETELAANRKASSQALTELAVGSGLTLPDLRVDIVKSDAFSVLKVRIFASRITQLLRQQPPGTGLILGFAMRRATNPQGQPIVSYPNHAIGVFVATDTEQGGEMSPLVVFDPNAGVYQIFSGREDDFFNELEKIYGDGSSVQLIISGRAQLAS
jgi:hypothetical protein